MNKEIIISVIIPLYNGKNYIRDCISSITKINHPYEILIIDDGSTDDSLQYCKKYYHDEKSIIVLHKENGGIASARNYGLKYANGKYVLFVDQDDRVIANTIDRAVDIMEKTDNQAVFWSTVLNDDGGEKAFGTVSSDIQIDKSIIVNSLIPKLIYNNENSFISSLGNIWAGLFQRTFIANNNIAFKSFVCYEDDFIFLLDFFTKAERIFLIKEIGYIWNQNHKSRSHKYIITENALTKNIQMYEYVLQRTKQLSFTKEEKEKLQSYSRQQIITNSIFYACSCYQIDIKELKRIKHLLNTDEYKKAFSIDVIEPFYESRTIIFYALKHHFFILACAEAFLFSVYSAIKFK